MNNITRTLLKGELIPRISVNRFLQENWDPSIYRKIIDDYVTQKKWRL